MRKHRVALSIIIFITALAVLIPATAGNTHTDPQLPQTQEVDKWSPLPANWMGRVKPVPPPTTTTTPPVAPVTTPTTTPVRVVSSPPVTPTTSPPVTTPAPVPTPVASGPDTTVDLLLTQAPAYVQAAFYCIATGESNHEPGVVNSSSGDGGLYQFNVGTWNAVLHRANIFDYPTYAQDATVAEQDTGAYEAWLQDGFSPWTGENHCWE